MYRYLLLTLALILSLSETSAQLLNKDADEKYTHFIVPMSFDFIKKENEYQLNSLVRYLFKEEGFKAFLEREIRPDEYYRKPCEALRVDVEKENFIVKTDMTVNLYDCYDRVVFSATGSSKEKGFREAYREGIKDAFNQLKLILISVMQDADVEEVVPEKRLTLDQLEEIKRKEIVENSLLYTQDENQLLFFETDETIEVYTKNAEKRIAKLTPINENMFIYNADDVDGIMRKLENGNFELEYREPKSKETKIIKYIEAKKTD